MAPTAKPVMEEQTVTEQNIVQGPMASQVAIKMLGTNGGGYVERQRGASVRESDAALEFLPDAVDFRDRQRADLLPRPHGEEPEARLDGLGGDGRRCFSAGVLLCWWARKRRAIPFINISASPRLMETWKARKFGSAFSIPRFSPPITTDASCGAVNSMHDSFTPLGGFVPLFNIQLGEIIFGGVGAGLYGMLVFVVLAVFIAGLMVGRTPEYLGKKIESYDVKMAMLSLLILAISILGFSAWAVVSKWGLAGLNNNGPHGLSEILYAFSSGTGNNGSAFAGLTANTPWYNTTLGLAMLFGRFLDDRADHGAGWFAGAKESHAGQRRHVSGLTAARFLFCSLGTVLLIGALNFVPALTLGPIVEHFLMQGGKLF